MNRRAVVPPLPALVMLLTLSGGAHAAETRACYATHLATTQSVERACSDVIAMLGSAPATLDAETRVALIAAYNNRAIARTEAGELDLATEDLSAALLLEPDHWALYVSRGNLRLAQQDYSAALADYQTAAEGSDDAAALARRNAVLAYRGLGDLGAAEAMLARVLAAEQTAGRSADRGSSTPITAAPEGIPAAPGAPRR